MNKGFLNKVLDRIVIETNINYGKKVIFTPFLYPPSFRPIPFRSRLFSPHSRSFTPLPPFLSTIQLYHCQFSIYCKEIYSLNEQDIKYLWIEYKDIMNKELA